LGNLNLDAITNAYYIAGTRILHQPASDTTSIALGGGALNSQTATNLLNTAVGYQSLQTTTTGNANAAFGFEALYGTSTGVSNSAFGAYAMRSNAAGNYNAAFGMNALYSNATGSWNTAVGVSAMYNTTNGFSNTALGSDALFSNVNGGQNVGLGTGALYANTTGSNNVAIGYEVGHATLSTGSSNILIGTSSAVDTPAADTSNWLNIGNTIYGDLSTDRVGIGSATINAGASLDLGSKTDSLLLPTGTTGQRPGTPANGMIRHNTTIPTIEAYVDGSWVDLTATGGAATNYLGASATQTSPSRSDDVTTGLFSDTASTVAIATAGVETLRVTATGSVGIGTATPAQELDVAGDINVSAITNAYYIANTKILHQPASDTTSLGLGGGTLAAQTATNLENTAIGYQALTAATASRNTAVGYQALTSNTTGYINVAVGSSALNGNTTGFGNIGIGDSTISSNATGMYNTAVGHATLMYTTGYHNTAIGGQALFSNTTGNRNTVIGSYALMNTATSWEYANTFSGSSNTVIGYAVGSATLSTGSGSNNILIGTSSAVDTPAATTNNHLNIGNTLYGDLSAGSIGVGRADITSGTSLDIGIRTDSILLPTGTTGQRPTGVNGMIRYNTTIPTIEAYVDGSWVDLTATGGAATNYLGASATQTSPSRSDDVTTGLFSDTASTVAIATAGVEALRVTATGSVGIGTTDPGYPLHVDGNAKFANIGIADADPGATQALNSSITFTDASGYGIHNLVNITGVLTAERTNYGNTNLITNTADNTSFANNLYANYNRITNSDGYGYDAAYGSYNYVLNNDTSKTNDTSVGSTNYVRNASTGTLTEARGAQNHVYNASTGTITNAYGSANVAVNEGGGTIEGARGASAVVRNNTGSITNAYGVYSLINQAEAGGTIDTSYAFYADQDHDAGTSNTAYLYYGTFSGTHTTKWGLYLTGETNNYLSGTLGIGTTTPAQELDVNGDINVSAQTNGYYINNTAVLTTPGGDQYSIAVGRYALAEQTTTGLYNTALGYLALRYTTTGLRNTAVGEQALYTNTTGSFNTAVGENALLYNDSGQYNTAVGKDSLEYNTASYNTGIGAQANYYGTTGQLNTALGYRALFGTSTATALTGGYNTAVGAQALYAVQTTAASNTALGRQAGYSITTGSSNTIIGHGVALATLTTGSNNILIGTSSLVDTSAASTSNHLNIGNTLYGDLSAGSIGVGRAAITSGASLDLGIRTDSLLLPTGTTGQRPSTPVTGMMRYNSTINALEIYQGSSASWVTLDSTSTLTTNVILGSSTAATNPHRSSDVTTGLFSPAASTVAVSTAGTEALRVTATQSVGIGTTTPDYLLHVADTAKFENIIIDNSAAGRSQGINMSSAYTDQTGYGINNDVSITGTLTANRTTYGGTNLITSTADNTSFTNNLYANYNRIINSNGTGYDAAYASYNYVQNDDASKTNTTTYGTVGYARNASTGTMTAAVGAGGWMYNASTGTVSTGSALSGTVVNDGAGTISTARGVYGLVRNDEGTMTNAYGVYSTVNQDVAGGTISNSYTFYANQDQDAGTSDTAYLYYGVYNGTHTTKWGIYLTGETNNYLSGNLGLGTADPQGKLEVAGQKLLLNYGGGSLGTNRLNTSSFGYSGLIIGSSNSAHYYNGIALAGYRTATTTPLGRITFNSWNTDDTLYNTMGAQIVSLPENTTSTDFGADLRFYTKTGTSSITERLRITATGTVGIGTSTPVQELDVAGDVNVNSWDYGYYINNNKILHTPASDPYSIAVGRLALTAQTATLLYNTAVGNIALTANTSGQRNTAVGSHALNVNEDGSRNTALGMQSLGLNVSGGYNTAVGHAALYYNTASYNTAVGAYAGYYGTTAYSNTAVGYYALSGTATASALTGAWNTAIGCQALNAVQTTAAANTALGRQAGYVLTTGSNNTIIGQGGASTTLTTGSNNILIGTGSSVTTPAASTSDHLNIGNTIYGDLSSGYVGIGTDTPAYLFHVNGSGRIPYLGVGTSAPTTSRPITSGATSTDQSISSYNSSVTVAGTLTANRTNYGIYNAVTSTADNTSYTNNLYGDYNQITNSAGTGYDTAYASYNYVLNNDTSKTNATSAGSVGYVRNASTGTLTEARGAIGQTYNVSTGTITNAYGSINATVNDGAGTISAARGAYANVRNDEGTITNAYGVHSVVNQDAAGGSITNSYTFYANQDQDAGTSGTAYLYYGVYTGTHTTKWGIYLTGEDDNYLSGNLSIGDTSPTTGASLDLGSKTDSMLFPSGTTAQRPSTGVAGMMRYNTSLSALELYTSTWGTLLTDKSTSGTLLGTSAAAANPHRSGDATTGLFSPAASTVAVSTAGTEALRVTSAGYVGIGTATPSSELHVQGTITTYSGRIQNAEANEYMLMDPADDSLRFYSNNVERLTILTSGYVGVGTATPAYLFHVNGSGRIPYLGVGDSAPSTSRPITSSATFTDESGQGYNSSVTVAGTLSAARTNYGIYNVMTSTADNTSYTNTIYGNWNQITNSAGTGYDSAYGSYNYVLNNDTSKTNNASIGTLGYARNASTGTLTGASGVVGYVYNASSGTITSSNGLNAQTVNDGSGTITTARGAYVYVRNDEGTIPTAYGVQSTINQDVAGGTITNSYAYWAGQDQDAGTSGTAYLYYGVFSGTHTTKWGIYLTGETKNYFSGSVGIGTDSPSYALDVAGGIQATGEIISTNTNQFRMINGNYGALFRNDGTSTYFLLTNSGDQYGTYNSLRPFRIYDSSGDVNLGNSALYVEHGGSVGIGTTSMSQKLDVAGNINATSYDYGYYINNLKMLHTPASDPYSIAAGRYALAAQTATGLYNTAFGNIALQSTTTGIRNTAVGSHTLYTNTTGSYNVAVGMQALSYNTTASNNTAVGTQAMLYATVGKNNVALGYYALRGTATSTGLTGDNNTAVGHSAMYSVQTNAIENTAVGARSLYSITTGDSNTSVGVSALYNNTTGHDNVAIGYSALYNNTTGYNNIALGTSALTGANGASYGNIVMGYCAGSAITTGDNNVIIGDSAGTTYPVTGSNNILIGRSTELSLDDSNQLNIGNTIYGDLGAHQVGIGTASPTAGARLELYGTGTATSSILIPRGTTATRPTTGVNGMIRYNNSTNLFEFYQNSSWVNYTTTSDKRLKKDIEPIVKALEIVQAMNPVYFKWDKNNPRAQGLGDDRRKVGLIAQELEQVLPEAVNTGGDTYRTLEYNQVVPVAVKAIQELKTSGDDQAAKLDNLTDETRKIKAELAALREETAAEPAGPEKTAIDKTKVMKAPDLSSIDATSRQIVRLGGAMFLLMFAGLGFSSLMLMRTRREMLQLMAENRALAAKNHKAAPNGKKPKTMAELMLPRSIVEYKTSKAKPKRRKFKPAKPKTAKAASAPKSKPAKPKAGKKTPAPKPKTKKPATKLHPPKSKR